MWWKLGIVVVVGCALMLFLVSPISPLGLRVEQAPSTAGHAPAGQGQAFKSAVDWIIAIVVISSVVAVSALVAVLVIRRRRGAE
jgi:hypothetical protein